MVTRIKYDNVCKVLIALFLANNLPWIGDRYCYYFIEYLTSYSSFDEEEGNYKEGFGSRLCWVSLGVAGCISKNGSREHR